jgi:hypothetical protein
VCSVKMLKARTLACVSILFCNGGWFHDWEKLLLRASGTPSTKE